MKALACLRLFVFVEIFNLEKNLANQNNEHFFWPKNVHMPLETTQPYPEPELNKVEVPMR